MPDPQGKDFLLPEETLTPEEDARLMGILPMFGKIVALIRVTIVNSMALCQRVSAIVGEIIASYDKRVIEPTFREVNERLKALEDRLEEAPTERLAVETPPAEPTPPATATAALGSIEPQPLSEAEKDAYVDEAIAKAEAAGRAGEEELARGVPDSVSADESPIRHLHLAREATAKRTSAPTMSHDRAYGALITELSNRHLLLDPKAHASRDEKAITYLTHKVASGKLTVAEAVDAAEAAGWTEAVNYRLDIFKEMIEVFKQEGLYLQREFGGQPIQEELAAAIELGPPNGLTFEGAVKMAVEAGWATPHHSRRGPTDTRPANGRATATVEECLNGHGQEEVVAALKGGPSGRKPKRGGKRE